MISHRIIPSARLILIRNCGEVTAAEFRALVPVLRADPGYAPGFDVLVDSTELGTRLTRESVQDLSGEVARVDWKGEGRRCAIVAPRDLAFGLSRMFQAMEEGMTPFSINVFRDLDAALEWLGRARADLAG